MILPFRSEESLLASLSQMVTIELTVRRLGRFVGSGWINIIIINELKKNKHEDHENDLTFCNQKSWPVSPSQTATIEPPADAGEPAW